jgi:hypothetical protein
MGRKSLEKWAVYPQSRRIILFKKKKKKKKLDY